MNCPGATARRRSIAGVARLRSARCARSSPRRRRRAAPRRRWRWWWRCRASTSSAGAWPQAITSALSASRRGAVSLAPAVSAARSAKPSTLARSNGGTSIGAVTSCASTRPSAAASATRLGRQRRKIEMPRKARARLLGRDHFEELLLPRGAADRGDADRARRDLGSKRALMATVLPRPRRPAG